MIKQRNILLNGVLPDPWIPIALHLEQEGHKVSYWIGWGDNGKKELVTSSLPRTIFHENILAWKGIQPGESTIKVHQEKMLPVEFWNNRSELLIALKMMDRLDADGYSFNFSEREDFIFDLATQWYNTLLNHQIDTVIFSIAPHRGFDYIIYLVAKYLGIDVLIFKPTFEPSLLYMMEEIQGEALMLPTKEITGGVSEKLTQKCKTFQADRGTTPQYMINQKKSNNNRAKIGRLTAKLRPGRLFKTDLTAHKYRHLDYYNLFPKNHATAYADSYLTLKTLKRLKTNYSRFVSKAEFANNKKYLLFALHYQPEETTVPSAGNFYNQVSIIKQLSQQMPDDWILLVKEHSTQFHPRFDGHKGRYPDVYSRIHQLPNVKMLDENIHSRELIHQVQAIVTLTGTIGIEALLCRKPVFLFGNSWYKGFKGIINIGDHPELLNDLKGILNDLPSVSDKETYNSLEEITKYLLTAYTYKNYEKYATFDKGQNATIVFRYLVKWFSKKDSEK
ncbi:MAG: hypothetical protein KL787_01445 [Taibaiella sp.]|nr:hypothetical protein [Taibaiella sp.]